MRWTINQRVMQSPALTPAAKLAWHQMKAELEQQRTAHDAQELTTTAAAIAVAQGISPRTAQRILDSLIEAGLVAIVTRQPGSRSPQAGEITLKILAPSDAYPRTKCPPIGSERRTNCPPMVEARTADISADKMSADRDTAPSQLQAASGASEITPPQKLAQPKPGAPPQHIITSRACAPAPSVLAQQESIPLERQEALQESSSKRTLRPSQISAAARRQVSGPAGDDEMNAIRRATSLFDQVLATYDNTHQVAAVTAQKIRDWLNDETLAPSVINRVAESLALGMTEPRTLGGILASVAAQRNSRAGLKKPAGALFIHLCRRHGIAIDNPRRQPHAQRSRSA
jgi:hypothetical protein